MTAPRAGTGPAGPLFLIGSMRSGSTLLRLILDSHPHIAIGSETGFMRGLRGAKEIPSWNFGAGWYERLSWSEDEFDDRIREFYDGMFRRFAAEQGKRRWGEKTPFHTEHILEMASIFPDSVFVGIVRHPGAVAASLRKNFHYTFPEAVSYWATANREVVNGGSVLGDRFALCRYEDLVTEQQPVLREILAFIGEPWDPAVLNHHTVQREKGAPRVVEGSTSTQDAIDPRRAGRWSDSCSEPDKDALRGVAGLAGYFGYDVDQPESAARLADEGSTLRWLLDGHAMAARRSRFAGRVDFDQRGRTIAPDASRQELAARLDRAEQALARARSRRAVRVADAMRRVQRGRSLGDVRAAWSVVHESAGTSRTGEGAGA